MSDRLYNPFREPEKSLSEIDWPALIRGRAFYPSPAAWEDEVLYFLLVDRFSDGHEYGGYADLQGDAPEWPQGDHCTPLFDRDEDEGNADRAAWFEAGKDWCGGTLAGLRDKLGYLQRLGVTALWLSPLFRQVTGSHDYHGYGIQNYLDVDPHLGTRQELRGLVAEAHDAGIRVILDIILNHAGDVFAYQGNNPYFYDQGRRWPVEGYRRSAGGSGSLPFEPLDLQAHPEAWPQGAVWPAEFQDPETWTRQGEIRHWDDYPEYIDGDFASLKDVDHGPANKDPNVAWDVLRRIDEFRIGPALGFLGEVYKFWLAYADLDGYRIDTVKHMEPGAVRYFANVIHEFAQFLGKENFYLIGEVTGGRAHAVNIVNTTGLDAALGIDDIQDKMEFLVKGWRTPGDPTSEDQSGYFNLFRNSLLDHKNTHQWYGRHIVTLFDDHDQVGVQHKFRFCGDGPQSEALLPAALGLNLTTMGIPCIYYGTEQAFNGADPRSGADDSYSDVFLRECMFGGPFGSFQSEARHFFSEHHPVYRFVRDLCAARRAHIALRRGRQYLRQVSASGEEGDFYFPQPINGQLHYVVAWSRLFAEQEVLCAINTDPHQALAVWVTVDSHTTPVGREMTCLLSTDPAQQGTQTTVEARNTRAVRITVPPAGFVIYR